MALKTTESYPHRGRELEFKYFEVTHMSTFQPRSLAKHCPTAPHDT